MYGGAVFPTGLDLGVAFGARVGLVDLFGRAFHAGLELDWWTADRQDSRISVRDAIASLSLWRGVGGSGVLRPFFGLSGSLHSLDAAGDDRALLSPGELAEARGLDGYRLGAAGFAGLTVRLSATGAIWLILEYRYAAVSRVSHHQLRAGARLLGPER